MKKMVIYDPAMCCSTGVCGPSVDKELLRVATVTEALKQKGADITRFNLSGQPNAFVENRLIHEQLTQHGPDILPVIVVDGAIVKSKGYPTNEEFSQWTGVELAGMTQSGDGCCCGGKCC